MLSVDGNVIIADFGRDDVIVLRGTGSSGESGSPVDFNSEEQLMLMSHQI